MTKSKKIKLSQVEDDVTQSADESISAENKEIDSDVDDNIDVTINEDTEEGNLFDSSDDSSEDEEDLFDRNRKPAWVDDNDTYTVQEVIKLQGRKCNVGSNADKDYKKTLEDNFQSVLGVPKWAQRKSKQPADDLLSRGGSLVKKSTALAKERLDIQTVKILNHETFAEGTIIKSTLFHPKSSVALVAGSSGNATIIQVDGNTNEKLQTIQFKDFPISCSQYANDGDDFIVGTNKYPYYYRYSMMTGQSHRYKNDKNHFITNMGNFRVSPDCKHMAVVGKTGAIHLLSARTNEYITNLRMNDEVYAVEFYDSYMFSHGSEGEVYIWDMNTRECVHKFIDDGCIHGTSLAVSPNGKLIACGSNSGVVNIYDLEVAKNSRAPKPLKTVLNLTTKVNNVKFNSTSEILAMTSELKHNAIKLLHCASMTVFANFPSFHSKFNKIQCVDFSPNSGFMAFGDNRKTAHLFRLNYYGNY